MKKSILFIAGVLALSIIAGCATFRSDIKGAYHEKEAKNYGAGKVSVLFIFSHYEQKIGYDAIPKLETKRQIIRDFDDLFIDALNELTNVGKYGTYTEFASDIADAKRRAEKDSMIAAYDYVLRMKFKKENSFAKHFLGTFFSVVSAATLPVPYSTAYSVSVDVYNGDDVLIGSYSSRASLTKWVQTLLVFIYPFHTERRKEEEIYIDFMHDVFRQIESLKVLGGA